MVISPVCFPYGMVPRPKGSVDVPQGYGYYQRGTLALVAGLMAIAQQRGQERVRVLFPDYFCEEPLGMLERFPIDVSFYPIQKNLAPEWTRVEEIFSAKRPDAFVLVHYFGFPNNVATARKLCADSGVELIEDCAHVLRPFGEVGTSGSLIIFSPWKLLPLPELGLLFAASKFAPFIKLYPPIYLPVTLMRWYIKREIQRLLCVLGINWYRRIVVEPSVLTNSTMNPNLFSMRLLHQYAPMLEWIRSLRIQNYRILEALFKEKSAENLLFQELPEGAVPYCFPYLTKEPAVAVSRALIQRGIPAYSWPTLPMEIQKDRARHGVAHWLAEHVLLLPIHQNVSVRQIEYIRHVLYEQ